MGRDCSRSKKLILIHSVLRILNNVFSRMSFVMVILCTCFPMHLGANPVIVLRRPPHPPSVSDLPIRWVPWMISFALLVEFVLLFIWITKRDDGRPWRIAAAIILMHLVTYPITYYLGSLIGLKAELFPLAFEVWLFPQLAGLSIRRTIVPVTVANLTSFTLGLVLPKVCVALFLPKVIF